MAHALQRIVIGDDPDSWRAAGFTVHGNVLRFGKVEVILVGSAGRRGVLRWKLKDVATDIDGLPTMASPEVNISEIPQGSAGPNEHTNAVFGIDHVVIQTGDVARTAEQFESVGIEERRSATSNTPSGPQRQSFFWAGRVIIEVVGPVEPQSDVETSFWGLALVSSNLQTTAHVFDTNLSEPRDAVQPGRKIATVRTKEFNISVPLAVLSPHVAELM